MEKSKKMYVTAEEAAEMLGGINRICLQDYPRAE